jgi:hypothetical protein
MDINMGVYMDVHICVTSGVNMDVTIGENWCKHCCKNGITRKYVNMGVIMGANMFVNMVNYKDLCVNIKTCV